MKGAESLEKVSGGQLDCGNVHYGPARRAHNSPAGLELFQQAAQFFRAHKAAPLQGRWRERPGCLAQHEFAPGGGVFNSRRARAE